MGRWAIPNGSPGALCWNRLSSRIGYLALFIGTFLEGETILIIAGIAASEGLLNINWVILSAFCGTLLGDQLYFLIGRYRGQWLLSKVPRWQPNMQRALEMLERHAIWVLLTYRFMYGVRNVTSFAVGMSRIRLWVFLVLNIGGAAIWAVIFGLGGYLVGQTLLLFIKDVKHYQVQFLIVACIVALGFWLYRLKRSRQKAAHARARAAKNKQTPLQ